MTTFGACWYPEHWPRERWAVDARLMREAGFTAVRLGEFAWGQLEPREGKFEPL
jgi:beta-galactosidase